MENWEIGKLSLLLGLVDSSGDFDEYFLYLLLPLGYGCSEVNLVFSVLLLAKGIFSYFNKPFCGLLVDSMKHSQHMCLIFSSMTFFLTAAGLMFFGDTVSRGGLVFWFLSHEFSTALMETNVWKVIKLRSQLIYGPKSVEHQERNISRIGINNALISDTYEMLTLIGTYWIAHNTRSYKGATLFLGANILVSDFLIVIISLTYTRYKMYVHNTLKARPNSHLAHDDEDDSHEPSLLSGAGLRKLLEPSVWLEWLKSIKDKLSYLWGSKLAFHALSQSLILYLFTGIAEYPLSFSLSDEADDDEDGESSGPPTLDNFCHNKIEVLVLLAVIDNAVYAAGSVIYSFFFVKMQPSTWFRMAYPVIASFVLGVVVSLWYVHDVVKLLAYTFTSVLIVVPYYCEKYNFYFASACIDEKYFGFTYSVLGIAKNALSSVISLVFLKAEDNLSKIFSLLLVVCGGLVISSIFYSVYIHRIYVASQRSRTSSTPPAADGHS